MGKVHELNKVFVPGGQPTLTYVPRNDLSLETHVKRAIEKPHYFASITGASKTGKTVLCRAALKGKQYIWIEGGQITPLDNLWVKVGHELKQPTGVAVAKRSSKSFEVLGEAEGKAKVPLVAEGSVTGSLKGSYVRDNLVLTEESVDLQGECIRHMIDKKIILVVDDFHYISRELQTELIRYLKGAVFEGLKVILLSVWYRAYEAVAAEAEIAGRLTHVDVPEWSTKDLKDIAQQGFRALNVKCPKRIIAEFSEEATGSPQLMQTFCWDLCFDRNIERTSKTPTKVPGRLNFHEMYRRISRETAQAVFDKLSLGPQARSARMQRPLKKGGTADIYQVVLRAIANSGPKSSIKFGEIRENVNELLSDNIPQQIEISNALKYLTEIATTISAANRPLDWNDEKREVVLPDPLFRFFLKWQITDAK